MELVLGRSDDRVLLAARRAGVSISLALRGLREMFMTLKTPEDRFDWLRRKHEWLKSRRDVSQ
jgi:hypothetical protein